MSTKGTFDYRWLQGERQFITLYAKSNRSQNIQMNKLNVEAGFQWSANPNASLELLLENMLLENHTETSFTLSKGPLKDKFLNVQYRHECQGSLTEHKVKSSLKIACLPTNTDTTFEFNHELTKKAIDTKLTMKSGSDDEVAVVLAASKNANKHELIRGLAKIIWSKHVMEINGNVLQPKPGDYMATVQALWDPNAEAKAVLTLRNYEAQSYSWGHKLKAEVTMPGQHSVILTGDVLLNNVERRILGEVQFDNLNYKTFVEYYRPTIENVRVHVGATSPTNKYLAKAEYHNSVTEKKATADLQLGHHRHIVADVDVKRGKRHVDVSLTSNFDFDHHPDRNYSMHLAHARKNSSNSQGSLTVRLPSSYDIGFGWNVSIDGSKQRDPYVLSGHCDAWWGEHRITTDINLNATLRPSTRNISAVIKIKSTFNRMGHLIFVCNHVDDGIRWNNTLKVFLDNNAISALHSEGRLISEGGRKGLEVDVKVEPYFGFESPIIINAVFNKTDRESLMNFRIHWAHEKKFDLTLSEIDNDKPEELNRIVNFNLTSAYTLLKHLFASTRVVHGKKTVIQSSLEWNDQRFNVDYESKVRRQRSRINSYYHIRLATPFERFENLTLNLKFGMDSSSTSSAIDFEWDVQKRASLEITKRTFGSQNDFILGLQCTTPFDGARNVTFLFDINRDVDEVHCRVLASLEETHPLSARFDLETRSPKDIYCGVEIDEPYGLFNHFDGKIRYFVTESQFLTEVRGSLKNDSIEICLNASSMNSRVNASKAYTGLISVSTPHSLLGKFKLALEHFHQPYLWKTTVKAEVLPSGDNYRVSLAYNVTQNTLTGSFELITPFPGMQTVEFILAYDRDLSEKSGSLTVNWKGAFINRFQSNFRYGKNRLVLESDLTVPTTLGFAFLKLNLNNTEPLKVGKFIIGLDDIIIQLYGEGKMIRNQGYLNLTLSTPYDGYEALNVVTAVNLKKSEKHVSLTSNSAQGEIKIKAFHKAASQSMDSGITFTSFISGFEKLYLGSHFESNKTGESKAQIKVEKGEFKAYLNVDYNVNPSTRYINIAFNSPIHEIKSLKFSGKYELSDAMELEATFIHNSKPVVDFKAKVTGDNRKAQVNVMLTTSLKQLESFTFDGRYELRSPKKYGEVTAKINNEKLNMKCELEHSRLKSEVVASLTSPFEGLENLLFLAGARKDGDNLRAAVNARRNSHFLEATMQSFWTNMKKKFTIELKTSLPGYELAGISLEDDNSLPKRHSKMLLYQEKNKISIEGDFVVTADYFQTVITSTIPGYDTSILSVERDRTKPKSLHLISFQNGPNKYVATWEFAHSPTYLEYKLQWKTPFEESMAYLNYNLNGANAVTFDMKLIKHKTMMEVSGRFWKLPGKPKADGSVVFNTNYLKMIAASVSGRCDLTGDTKDLIFQFDINGKKAEMMASAKTVSSIWTVIVNGSSSFPDWRTFGLSGTVDGRKSEKVVKMTLTRNSKNVQVTGSMFYHPQSTKAQLTLSTPLPGYEFLLANVVADFSKPQKRVNVVIKQNTNTLLNVVTNHYIADGKMTTDAKVQSQIPGIPNMEIDVTMDSTNKQKLFLKFKVNDQIAHLDLKGNANSTNGNFMITVSGNLIRPLFSTNDGILEVRYNTMKPFIYALVTSNGFQVYEISLDVPKRREEPHTVNHSSDKEKGIQTTHDKASVEVVFKVRVSGQDLVSMSSKILRRSADFKIASDVLGKDLLFSVNYDFGEQKKIASLKYKEGSSIFELEGHFMIEPLTENDRSVYDAGISLKTPWKRLENAELSLGVEKTDKFFKLNSIIKATPLLGKVAELLVDVNYSTGFEIGLSSSFEGYESVRFYAVHSVEDTRHKIDVAFDWSTQKVALSLEKSPGKIDIVFISPFSGFERLGAVFLYGTEPLKASLILSISPSRKIEMTAQVHLGHHKGTWSAFFLPLDTHKPYVLEGSYDFTLNQIARLYAEGQGKKFEAAVKLTGDMASSRQLNVEIITPMTSFYRFSLKAEYSSSNNATAASLRIQANDMTYHATGNVRRHEDGFEFEMKANSPVDGYQFLTINGQGNVTGSRRFMDLFFKMDEQSVVVFRGEVTQRLPYEFTSTVRLVTPLQGITNIGWDASYRLENTVIEASTALLWQANTIQLLSRLSPDEMKFTMTTPFSYLNNVRYDGKLIVNELNFLMSSTLKVNDNQYTLKVVMDHELRSYFNATVELWTPFETFHHLDASLKVNYKSDEPFTASFTIETPFDGFPKAEVLLVIDNTVSRNVKTHLQVNLAGLQYSVEGMAYDDGAGNCNWTTIVKTPHRGYEVITASRHTFYKDSAERGEELLIQTPTAKHSMRWSFVLKPENLGFEIFCDSPLLPNSPMSIQVLYIIQDNQVSLRVATRAGGCRRTLTWIQTPDVAGVYKGMMSYERVAFDEDTWSLEYLLDSTSSASARFTAVINLIHQINSSKYNISSLSIIFGNRAPNFNVNFLITENNNDHKFNFGYKIDESTFDCSLQIISTLLTHKSLLLTGHVNPREVNVVLTLGNIQNVFNMNYKTSIKESDGAIKIKAPIWNIDTTLKGRFQMNAYQLKGEISLQDQKYTHSLSILFQHSAEEWFVRLNLRTPLYDFGSLVVESRTNCECEEEGKQKINVVTKVFFQRQVHRVTLSLVKDAATMEGLLKVESPALQSPKGLVVHARILKVTANERNGLITITHGDHEHKAELNVLCDPSKVYSAEAKVDTPYWGINALSVKSQLLTDVHGNSIDTSLIVNFSEATHTVTCKLDRDPSMKQIYVYIYTPYLGFEPYSLSAKVIHETKGIEVSASLQLAEVNHTLDFFVTKKNKGFSIQATVNTPLLDSDEVTFIVNVIRLDSTGLEAAFELNWRSVVHTMNFTAWLESGLAFFNATVKTPLFNVGRVMASGRIFTTKHNQLNFEMTAKTSEKEYNIRGYVGLTTTGIIGDIQINDLAGLGPFEFHVDVTKASMEGVEAICTIKTSNNHHNFRGHLRRNTGFLDFHLKVNSSALSFQDFAVTGNVTFQFPLYVECNFVVETSGQLFKILSNYHSNNADGVEGDLTVVTPFHSLPFLRINGKLSRNPRLKGINGGLEMYMADESFPQVAASVKLEEDDHNHSLGIVRLQIPILGYEDVTVHLGTKVLKDSSRYHILKYKANDYAYGYEVLLLKKYNARKVNSKVFIGQRTYAMQAALERNLYHYNVDFILETPIHRLSYIKYEAQYEWRQPNQRVLQTSLSVNDLKVLVRGEWNYSSLYNFDCLATIDTSLQNFEKINIKLQQHYDDHQLRFLLEQSFDDKESTFALLMDFEQKGSNGSGLIQLTTPMNALQTADAYYKYDHFGNHINGDVGLNHNGRQILEMKATAKDDIKVLEILNPIRPITIQYSFVNRDGILHVSGEYCWDSSRRFESSIGFDATITVTKYGRQVIIRSIHPKKPLTMSFQLETTPTLFVQTGELSWGNGDSSITSYEIRMLKDTMSNGKRTYDTTIRVVLPFRSLELTTRCECSGGSHYSSTAFKWDAQKDPDKVVILKTQDEDHSTSTRLDRRAEISIVYPKLNQVTFM